VDDWDNNGATPDIPLTIRLGQLFSNPPQDWKTLFPAYAVSVVRKPSRKIYLYEGGTASAYVTAPGEGNFYGTYGLNVHHGQVVSEYFAGDNFLQSELKRIVADQYTAAQALPGWTGYFSGSSTFGDFLVTGPQAIDVFFNTYTEVGADFVFVPVITWNADTFDEWAWPDPTFRGVLPGMGNSDQLLTTFGITADQWNKQVVLDWTGLGTLPARRRPLP
jgi:hypothetical protein